MTLKKKSYYSSTPVKMRKLGDAILASTQMFGGGLTISQLTTEGPVDRTMLWISLAITILGAVGKFLTNFYSEDPVRIHVEEPQEA